MADVTKVPIIMTATYQKDDILTWFLIDPLKDKGVELEEINYSLEKVSEEETNSLLAFISIFHRVLLPII